MRKVFTSLILICITFSLYGQNKKELVGTISFITSKNVYVQFDSTESIEIGDKLQLSGGTDCLQVTDKSSKSIICTILNDCLIKKGDEVIFKMKVPEPEVIGIEIIQDETDEGITVDATENPPTTTARKSIYSEKIRGRISAASYNNFSNLREDRHRLMTRFSLNADHISDSKFSIESYLSYRNVIVPSDSHYKGRTSIFNVYNLNVKYDATESLYLALGRRINPKAWSIGAVDGLQVEKYFGNFYVGALGGFRPDYIDYGFNSDLLQYGGYVGIETNTDDFVSQTTVGAVEQTNGGATDRRFIYFQHSSTIANNLNLFGSTELDIYGITSGDTIPRGDTRLTNLYLSARYRFSRAANLMISYDSRRQIIYYETFQTEIERLLDDDLARQGFRARLNIRPAKILWIGLSYSKRFQKDNDNKSDNIYGYVTLTKIPKLDGRINVSYNSNTSNYLKSNIISVRYSREFLKNKLSADFNYRMANYTFENQNADYSQNYYGIGLSYRISRSWQFSISGELSKLEADKNYRFYSQLVKRFYSKKKNKK